MRKSLGLLMLTFYSTGMILGAGVYSLIGKAAGVAQQGLWFSVVLAAVAALLTALSYAELSTLFPKAGAEYVYLREILPQHKVLSFLCGCLMVFAAISSASTVALSFSAYMGVFWGVPKIICAIGVLAVFTLINIWGVRLSGWLNIVFTLVEISGLLVFIYYGIRQPDFGEALKAPLSWGVASGASLIFFAYLGFESIVNLAEETKNPKKIIPQAILGSLALTTVLYVLVSLSALALMDVSALSFSDAVLSEALRPYSVKAAGTLGGVALFATANTVMISLLAASRIALGMARERDLPRVFAMILPRRQSPWLSSIFIFFVSLIFLLLEKIEVLASVSSFVTIVVFVIVNGAVIYFRRKEPQRKRAFYTPWSWHGYPVLPMMAVAASLFLLGNFDQQVYLVGSGIIMFVLLSYRLLQLRAF
nr:APC family permease [Bdellovibrio sp. CKG001]